MDLRCFVRAMQSPSSTSLIPMPQYEGSKACGAFYRRKPFVCEHDAWLCTHWWDTRSGGVVREAMPWGALRKLERTGARKQTVLL